MRGELVVQTSDRACVLRTRVAVLHEVDVDAGGLEGALVVRLREEAARVTMPDRLDDHDLGECCFDDVHGRPSEPLACLMRVRIPRVHSSIAEATSRDTSSF